MTTTASNTSAMMTRAIGTTRSYNTLDGTRGVCLRVEDAGGFGSSSWLIHTLLAVSLVATTLYDRQAICQTAGALRSMPVVPVCGDEEQNSNLPPNGEYLASGEFTVE